MRKLFAAIVAVGLVASLAACSSESSSDSTSASCSTKPASGDASSLVKADGDVGTKTTVTFPTPLVAKSLQVTDLAEGDGETLSDGDWADFQATIWNAETGAYVTGTSFDAASPSRMAVGEDAAQLGPLLECAVVGSRIAAVSTLEQLFGDVDASADGLTADSNLVVVVDVTNGIRAKADGADQVAQAGFPSVVTAPDGTPGVTIPSSDAPTEKKLAVLKKGDGATVKEGDNVVVQYEGLVWDSPGSVFANTWSDTPANYVASAYTTDGSGGYFPGFDDAVVGQTVGSQVILVVPPADSYGDDATAPDSVATGSTRIYVVDILDVLE